MKKIHLIILILCYVSISCSKNLNNNDKSELEALTELCTPVGYTGKDIKTVGADQRYTAGERDSAEKCYKIAIEEDNNAKAMRMLGVIYFEDEKYDLSEQYYKMSITNGGTDALYELGKLYFTLDKYDLAEKYYKQALDNPNFGILAKLDLGILYFKEGKYVLSKEYLSMISGIMQDNELDQTLEKLKKMGY